MWGVYPFVSKRVLSTEQSLEYGVKVLKQLKLAQSGNYVIMVSTMGQLVDGTSMIAVHRV